MRARRSAGRLAETSTQARLLAGFAETFGLDKPPRRIEVYDNSHIMGTNAVGAMIVAGPEGFVKNQYRKFNIRSTDITPGDDFGMMREVMERRFSRLIKEHGAEPGGREPATTRMPSMQAFPAWPDVILIDGGQGQMTAVRAILARARHRRPRRRRSASPRAQDRDAGRERFFIAGQASRSRCRCATRCSISCSGCATRRTASPSARTAPGARRRWSRTRSTRSAASARRASARCSMHFGTAKAVSRAAMEDLMAVDGISESVARLVYNHFHENG